MTLLKRSITSFVLISIIIWVLFKTPAYIFCAALALVTVLALGEYFVLLKSKEASVSSVFGVCLGFCMPIIVYLESNHPLSLEVLLMVLGCLFLFVTKFIRGDQSSLIGISMTLFGMFYVGWLLSFLMKIRLMDHGALWVAYLLAVTKAADIGAYLTGSLIGRHALIPQISPNKTIEGTLGGFVFSAAASAAFSGFLPAAFSYAHLIWMGLFLGVIAMIGDLSESLFKRYCAQKDSSRTLPGLGGILDVVDSVLFTAPIFYYHLKLFI